MSTITSVRTRLSATKRRQTCSRINPTGRSLGHDGGSAPNPRDLALLFSRMDAFCFTGTNTRRTIEILVRRIGQRTDATRAVNQARNGWWPQGRRLDQPATPSEDRRSFVQTMGSTSHFGRQPQPVCRFHDAYGRNFAVLAKKRSSQKGRLIPKTVLRLPDLDQTKSAVLNSLSSHNTQYAYRHAIDEFIEWYCSEPSFTSASRSSQRL